MKGAGLTPQWLRAASCVPQASVTCDDERAPRLPVLGHYARGLPGVVEAQMGDEQVG